MTFNSCEHCGSIKETATIRLNKLKSKINNKINVLKFGTIDTSGKEGVITDLEMWEWTEEIQKALEEI